MRSILLVVLAVFSSAGHASNLAVAEIADGVWVHTSGSVFPGNGLLVRDGDGLILVDTAWGMEATHDLLEWIDAQLALPVTKAIVTHFHEDSIGGAAALEARGIPVFSNALTPELAAGRGAPLQKPHLLVLEPGESVEIGEVVVFYPGPAHSIDNLVVWAPTAKVLFGGCAVRTPEYPGRGNTADADLENWALAIRRAHRSFGDTRIVVPGHGAPGDVSLLLHTIELFEEAK